MPSKEASGNIYTDFGITQLEIEPATSQSQTILPQDQWKKCFVVGDWIPGTTKMSRMLGSA